MLAVEFPKPKPTKGAPPGAGAAIKAGEDACRGKTPVEVRDRYMARAEASGLLNEGLEKMIAEIEKYEKQAKTSPDFVAGQLAAEVYEASRPEKQRRSGYQGCVYQLAMRLRNEISAGK